MNNNDERSIVSIDSDKINHAQGNNVLNSNRSTVKINSLSIKLGIVKEKNDAEKCRHFSIRGYVSGMREKGSNNLLPFSDELPPMDIPNFRYWLCQRCLQNNGTENAAHETPLISACEQCLFRPSARSCHPAVLLPFGEGTSGVKSVDGKNDGESECVAVTIGLDKSQPSPGKVKISQEIPKFCSVDTHVAANSKNLASNDLKSLEEIQKTKETVTGQPIEMGQQDEYPNGHPKRKARKVRLLKELLCGKTEIQQHKKENLIASSSQIKRKIPHDDDLDHDHAHVHVHDQRPVDHGKKVKSLKGNTVAKDNVPEHSREPVAREIGETRNKFQWNKHGTQRSSVLGKSGSDAMTAWKSIFSDMGKTDNQVIKNAYGVPKSRGSEPYSNSMVPPKPDKKFNSKNKIPSLKNKFFGESSKRIKDRQSDTELGLGLSLNYDSQTHVRSQLSILNRNHGQDHGRKTGFFLGESSSFDDVSNRHVPRATVIQEQRPYTQVPYGGCSGHQKLDFSDPHKRNNGVRGYSPHNHQNLNQNHSQNHNQNHNHNHQRQENMFSIGRSDEREIIELMAKNQYERNLCDSRAHFSTMGNNGLNPNSTGFRKVNMNEGMTSSLHHHEYINMMRPMTDNVGPTMRNPGFTMFDGLTHKPTCGGVWIPDSGSQRHYDYHLPKGNNTNNNNNNNNKMGHNHIYNPTSLHGYNKFNNGSHQNETVNNRMLFGQPYVKYSEKDKGKNMMDLDLNVVASNVVEDYNNLESLEMQNPKRKSSFDSSYSNEAIPAMQLLSLMDAGKSSQPYNTNGQTFSTRPISPCYNGQCRSTVAEKMSPIVNPHFTYSGLRPGVPNPIAGSFSSVFQTGQNGKLTSGHGQQGYYKPQEDKSRGYNRPDDSYTFPLPWHATEDRNKLVNGVFGPAFGPSGSEICTINRNPADFSSPGPDNIYMINVEDMIKSAPGKGKCNGPKKQKVK